MEPRALDRLKRMSATLSAAKALTYRSRSTVEVPANTGQLVTLFATSDVALERPNKLRVHVTGEVPNFDFYYNGTTITAFAPQKQVYSVANAPATIDATLKFMVDKTGIQFPSADVMYSDPYAMLTTDVNQRLRGGARHGRWGGVRASGVHGARGPLGNLDRDRQERPATAVGGDLHGGSEFPALSGRILRLEPPAQAGGQPFCVQ